MDISAGEFRSVGIRSSGLAAVERPNRPDIPSTRMLCINTVAPNPFNAYTTIWFEAQESARVSLNVYDVSGRRVRSVPLGDFGPGSHQVEWDGLDSEGNRIIPGVYFIHLQGPTGPSRAVKVVTVQ
jgi:hypothetical protein